MQEINVNPDQRLLPCTCQADTMRIEPANMQDSSTAEVAGALAQLVGSMHGCAAHICYLG